MIAIRGAITAENTKEDMLAKTRRMLCAILEENAIRAEEVLSVTFSATKDLDQVYPAVAARELGLTAAALFCVQEMAVAGSLAGCIRVMVLAESEKKQAEAKHVYLEGAAVLRPDLKRS